MYQKEIIYMGLHKDGSRLGSAGFLKVESRDKESSLFLKIKNIPHSISGRFPVRFYNGSDWKEVDGITLQEGNGLWEECEPKCLRQVRLQIILPGGYLIEGISKQAQTKTSERQEDEGVSENNSEVLQEEKVQNEAPTAYGSDESRGSENQVTGNEKAMNRERATAIRQDNADTEMRSKAAEEAELTKGYAGEEKSRAAGQGGVERIPVQKQRRSSQETISEPLVMVSEELPPPMADEMQINGVKEDKWEQILDSYTKIHPYGDERVYVKLEPKDFVILQAKYQHLVNNSFLLHGFYNYRYVILGKENDYYLGVPGVFYEREKMVALMFGFEAFECSGGEAKPGEFGYYLRRVEL